MSKKPLSTLVSKKSLQRRLALLGLLALALVAVSYPPYANKVIDKVNNFMGLFVPHIDKGFVLGLDLQGGTKLDYEADMSHVPSADQVGAIEGVRDVIERRVNALGVSEPLVTTLKAGDSQRVSVELAGIRDVNIAIKMIGETPILEFKEEGTGSATALTPEQLKEKNDKNTKALQSIQASLITAKKDPSKFEALVQTASVGGGDIGFIKDKSQYAEVYKAIKNLSAGSVYGSVIEQPKGYTVAKVEEVKPTADKEIKASHILISFTGAMKAPANALSKTEALVKAEQIKKELTVANFATLAKKYSQDPSVIQNHGDLGWFGAHDMVPEFENGAKGIAIGAISDPVESPFGYHIIYKMDERVQNDIRARIVFQPRLSDADLLPPGTENWVSTQLTGKQLSKSAVEFDSRSGAPQVSLKFNDDGAKLFGEITKRNIGKRVAIFLDGKAISTPVVQSEITGGNAVINGTFSVEEAKLLAQRLQAGALPVPIKLIAQQSVGPTLGADSIHKSMTAGLWGVLFVALFMILVYRAPGLISVIGLAFYIGISAAIFKLVPITMSLSGIAGFILSMGIALDANVLVFERLKEELKLGKTYAMALEDAFKRAWTSIRDGNMTTLISCAVLYWFSSSVIKGFALTLAVGIAVSLCTSIIIVRTMLRYIAMTSITKKMRWLFLQDAKDEIK